MALGSTQSTADELGEDVPQHPLGRPRHRRDRRDAEPLIDRGPPRVVDAGHDPLDAERLAGDPGDHDVRVVPVRDRGQSSGLLDAGLREAVSVEPDAGDRLTGEALPRRSNASGRLSMIATEWPASMRPVASDEPTRPHPTTTTCTSSSPCPAAASRQRGVILGTDLPGTLLASDTMTTRVGDPEATRGRGSDPQQRRTPPAAHQEDRARRVRVRCDLVDRLRDAGDPARPRAGRGHGRARGHRPARPRRRASCSPSSSRATGRRSRPTRRAAARYVVSRRTSAQPFARRGRVDPRRLRPDGRGVGISRCRRHRLGVPRAARTRVVLCLGFIVLMTLANLRGLKESGRLFAGPDLHLRRRALRPHPDRAGPLVLRRPRPARR